MTIGKTRTRSRPPTSTTARCAIPDIRQVPPPEIEGLYAGLRPLVLAGLRHSAGTMAEQPLLAGLLAGTLQLWIVLDPAPAAIAVTTVTQHEGQRVLSVLLLAGRGMPSWQAPLQRRLEAYGRDHLCTALEALVRPGLAGAVFRRDRAALKDWHPEKVLMRHTIPPPG